MNANAVVAAAMVAIDEWLESQSETAWMLGDEQMMLRVAGGCVLRVYPGRRFRFSWNVGHGGGDNALVVRGEALTVAEAVAQAEHMAAFWESTAHRGAAARVVEWWPATADEGGWVADDD